MKKNRFAALCALLILTASVLFTGCEAGGNGGTQNEANTSKNTTAAAATTADTKQESTDTSDDTSDLFTERDLQQTADLTDAQTITVSDRDTVHITEAGVYVLQGNAKNACVLVEAGDDDKVQLVLAGLTIENNGQPCILVESADKVFLTSAEGSENKLVRLDFQIVRAKWTDLMAAGGTDGCPGLPAETILEKLSKSNQLRDLYSPSFRVIPSQEPVTIQLNAKTQFVPLKWIPAQDYGVPAIPINSEAIWTGTTLKAAARVLNDGNIVRLDYRFEKVAQTGWRNYGYSFFGEPAAPVIVVQQDRYARPQSQQQIGPEIDTGLLKLPMIDTTAFRQALYLEVGKPVLAARISNPAYQPDMLTLLFVTATVEDAP